MRSGKSPLMCMNSPASRAVRADNPIRNITIARRSDSLLLIAVLTLVCLLRLPGFVLPLERDEGAYGYVAWSWLHGELPYRDAFDHKPPLIYLLYMPALLGSQPPTAWVLRAWATLLFLLAVGLVYLIGHRIWQRPAALLAALIFGVAGSAFGLQGLILNTDQALVLPALGALWYTIRLYETQQLRYAVAAGAALAATILIKPVAIVLVPCLLLASHWDSRSIVRVSIGAALGAMLVGLPIAGYFALRGGWHDLVFGVWTYNLLYAQESQQRWQLGALVDMFAPFVPLLLVALGGVALLRPAAKEDALLVLSQTSRRGGWLVTAWAAALLLAALGSLRPFVHYYYPLLPVLALLAAPCICWLWTSPHDRASGRRGASRAAAVLLALLLMGPFTAQNLRLFGTSAEQQAEQLYGDVGKHYFAQAPLVAAYLRERTQPDDYVYVFAAEPEVYLLAERRSSSRYIYDYPFQHVPGARAELQRDLAARPPRLIVSYYGVRPDGFFETLRSQNMVKLTEIGGYEIFGPR